MPKKSDRRLTQEQQQFVSENIGLCHSFAARYAKKNKFVSYQEALDAAYVAMIKCVFGYKKEKGVKFSTYFFTAAAKETYSNFASKTNNPTLPSDDFLYFEDRRKLDCENEEILDWLMSFLTPNEKHVIDQVVFFGKKQVEVAREMGVHIQTGHDLYKFALRKMRWAAKAMEEREYQLS